MIITQAIVKDRNSTKAFTDPAYTIVHSPSKGASSEYENIEKNINTKNCELDYVLESANNIVEFERRVELLRNILLEDKTALSESEMLKLKNIFECNQQLIANKDAGQLILLSLASLLEPLIEKPSYSSEISSIVKILLKSPVKALRYAALNIIESGLDIVPVAAQLLWEARNLLKNEEHGYVLDYLESLLNRGVEYYDSSLFWSKSAYAYITHQSKLFHIALPELAKQYSEMYVLFENGQVIDADADEDKLFDRAWETDFVKSRVEKYQAVFCKFVPILSKKNE